MSLSVLRAHVEEMTHDLVKELRGDQGNGGAELDPGKGPGGDKSSPQESYRACRPGGIQRGAGREAGFEGSGNPLHLAPGATRNEGNGWPWFTGLCTDYVSFKLDWEKYHGKQPRSMSQAELVRQFRENCMSKKRQRNALKVPKCEIFDSSDFHYFYTIKPFWIDDFGVKILTYFFKFWGSQASFSFLCAS